MAMAHLLFLFSDMQCNPLISTATLLAESHSNMVTNSQIYPPISLQNIFFYIDIYLTSLIYFIDIPITGN